MWDVVAYFEGETEIIILCKASIRLKMYENGKHHNEKLDALYLLRNTARVIKTGILRCKEKKKGGNSLKKLCFQKTVTSQRDPFRWMMIRWILPKGQSESSSLRIEISRTWH